MIVDIVPTTRLPRGISDTYSYAVPEKLVSGIRPGVIVEIPFRNRRIDGLVKAVSTSSEIDGLKEIGPLRSPIPLITPEQMRLAKWLSNTYSVSLASATKLFVPDVPKKEMRNEKQEIEVRKKSTRTSTTKIFGTGSRKEVGGLVKSFIKQGQQILLLVPEKTQTEKVVTSYGLQVTDYLHWHQTTAKKKNFQEYLDVLNRDTNLIVGTRSALFAPFANLGLIIMEDESNSSYKSEASPKYHARDVAHMLAELHGATLAHITNAPSLETYQRVPSPVSNEKTDPVVIDMKEERLKKNFSNLSEALQDTIEQSLKDKKQVFLFLNRRGHSTGATCQDCGYTIHCPDCDLPLTYHSNSKLICHHCRHREDLPPFCPKCSSAEVKLTGKGTQKLEEEVKGLFPKADIMRLDSDSVGKRFKVSDLKFDILIGTELAISRLDWERVGTVGVINADQALYRPDFRAGESTYQMLKRFRAPHVIIQTYNPESTVMQAIAKDKPTLFYEHELELRKALSYPPFSTVLKMTYRHTDEKRTVGEAMHMYHRLRKHRDDLPKAQIMKPYPAYQKKSGGKYQFHLIVKIPRDAHEETTLEKINELITEPGWVFDRDPESLL